MRSSGVAPACSAAARMNSLMLDPVWLGASARLTSFCPGSKPLPPTIARIAPVSVSSDVSAASMPDGVVGQFVAGLARPRAWRNGSSVVWMRSPPRCSLVYRSSYVSPRMSERFSR